MQKALGSDGNLILTTRDRADAILRLHIKEAVLADTGDPSVASAEQKDPQVFEDYIPAGPSEFRRITSARSFKSTARLSAKVVAELWHLKTRKKLFQRTYPISASMRTFRSSDSGNVTTIENDFLRFEEAVEQRFAYSARALSRRIVRDMISR